MCENKKRCDTVVWGTLIIYWGIASVAPFASFLHGRWLADMYDLIVYFEKGKWLLDKLPATSEYPQIPTWLFGIDRWLVSWIWDWLQGPLYIALFSGEMLIVLFLVYKALKSLAPRAAYALLVLLPPVMYFSYSRFDILPAFLALVAYSKITQKRWWAAGFWLSIATFTKWYPILLFPGFFVYAMYAEERAQWRVLLAFVFTSSVVVVLSYLQGGITALTAPYLFHLKRGMEYIALPKLIYPLFSGLVPVNLQGYYAVFFLLQIIAPLLLVYFTRIDTPKKLAYYSIAVIGMFILFSRIWSPQWFLWLMPFLILLIEQPRDLITVILFAIVVFASFPIVFDKFGANSVQLVVVGIIYYGMILMFIAYATVRLCCSSKNAHSIS